MRFRDNVMLQYSLATIIVAIAVAAAFGAIFTRAITDYQIRSHIRLYPEVMRLATRDSKGLYSALRAGGPVSPETEALLRGFLSLGSVFRVKVWNAQASIVWSDRRELLGRRFGDDDAFRAAMGGKVTYLLGQPGRAENIYERDRGPTLEIYAPITDGAEVVGVLELYEAPRDLFAQIANISRFIWRMVVLTGAAIYSILFLIFYRSHKVQTKARLEASETQDVTIYALARLAELRDPETGTHIERTASYVRILAEDLKRLPQFKGYLTPGYIEGLVKSAPLHDIGKVGVPDAILFKPGALSAAERMAMQEHAALGARILGGSELPLLKLAAEIAQSHQEK